MSSEATTLTAADFAGLGTCVLVPEQTEGPFYLDADLVRRDITEGLSGHPLRLGLRVVDAACEPLPAATVDVWHADVDGDYSAYSDGSTDRGDGDGADGTTFLRGSQLSDDEGIVEFATVYPGWYRGRTVHIHCKVHLADGTMLTTQLYFPEDRTAEVYGEEPYAARAADQDTHNADDSVSGGDPAANGNLLSTSADGAGTTALLVVGVDPAGAGS